MKIKFAFFALISILVLPVLALAVEKKADDAMQAPGGPTPEEMKRWHEASTPNDNHKVLDVLTGEWSHSMRGWMAPDSEPMESTGTTSAKWILGGRFLQSEVRGMAMGQPFEGQNTVGYNNMKKQYDSVWLDNMSTGMMISTSKYDTATKTFSEKGSFSCPMTGDVDQPYRSEMKIADNDNYTYTMYSKDKDGKEFKSMEIKYSRKK